METKFLVMAMLAGSSLCADTHISIGIGIGTPGYYPPPSPVVAYAPPLAPVQNIRGSRATGIRAAPADPRVAHGVGSGNARLVCRRKSSRTRS